MCDQTYPPSPQPAKTTPSTSVGKTSVLFQEADNTSSTTTARPPPLRESEAAAHCWGGESVVGGGGGEEDRKRSERSAKLKAWGGRHDASSLG